MRVTSLLGKTWQNETAAVRGIAGVARDLLTRRRFQYAALALAIVAGSAYVTDAAGLNQGAKDMQPQAQGSVRAGSLTTATDSVTGTTSTTQQRSDNTVSNETNINLSSDSASARTSVTVNGQDVDLPANGATHKTIKSNDGNTSINISNTSSGTGSNTASTTLDVHVESESTGGTTNE